MDGRAPYSFAYHGAMFALATECRIFFCLQKSSKDEQLGVRHSLCGSQVEATGMDLPDALGGSWPSNY